MTVLDTKIETPEVEAIEAADSRFFCAREAQDLSLLFFAKNSDLLHDDKGVFLQVGVMPDGAFIDLKDTAAHDFESNPHRKVLTAGFDASERGTGRFTWSVMLAEVGDGRELVKLNVGPDELDAERTVFDAQGRVRNVYRDEDPAAVFKQVKALVHHEKATKFAEELRERRRKAEEDLSSFVLGSLMKLAPAKLDKQKEKKEKNIAEIGFGRLT